MKKVFVLALFLFTVSGFAKSSLEGVESPDKAVKDFFSALKEGSKGVDKALDNISGLNSESRKYAEKHSEVQDLSSRLKDIMIKDKQGAIIKYEKISEDIKLNGDMIKREYSVKFRGGVTKTIKFIFIKPSMDGNFHLMDSKLID